MCRRHYGYGRSARLLRALGAILILAAAAGGGCRRAVLHALWAPSPAAPEERIEAAGDAPAEFEAVVRRVATGEGWLTCTVTPVRELDALPGRLVEFETNVSAPFEGRIRRSDAEPHALVLSGKLPGDMRPPEIGETISVRFVEERADPRRYRPRVSDVPPFR